MDPGPIFFIMLGAVFTLVIQNPAEEVPISKTVFGFRSRQSIESSTRYTV